MIDIRMVLGLLLAVFVFGVWTGNEVTSNNLRVLELKASENQVKAVKKVIADHNIKVAELRKINDETLIKLQNIETNTVVTTVTGDSLQQQFSDSMCKQSRPTNAPATIANSAADATTSLVHSYVFGVVKQRAIAYGKTADESRERGLACEAEYRSATAVRL